MSDYAPQVNPNFVSQALYIDFSRLPPPNVIEAISYETLLQNYKDRVVKENPALEKATSLEQSPINIILQAEAYGEELVRSRVNAAARAVMLPFAAGADLDNLAASFQQGFPFAISRLPLTSTARSYNTNPEDWEDDARFRRRIQLVPEAYSTAGASGAYIFHAMSSDVTIRDVSVTKINDRGGLRIAVMNSSKDPTATPSQLEAVTTALFSSKIKPLTDVLSISSTKVISVDLDASVTLYPGPDAGLVMSDIQKALVKLRERVSLLGRDLTQSAIYSALMQEGVQNVKINSPSGGDVVVSNDTCVYIKSASVTPSFSRGE